MRLGRKLNGLPPPRPAWDPGRAAVASEKKQAHAVSHATRHHAALHAPTLSCVGREPERGCTHTHAGDRRPCQARVHIQHDDGYPAERRSPAYIVSSSKRITRPMLLNVEGRPAFLLLDISLHTHASPCMSMHHGCPWMPMHVHACPWMSMHVHGSVSAMAQPSHSCRGALAGDLVKL